MWTPSFSCARARLCQGDECSLAGEEGRTGALGCGRDFILPPPLQLEISYLPLPRAGRRRRAEGMELCGERGGGSLLSGLATGSGSVLAPAVREAGHLRWSPPTAAVTGTTSRSAPRPVKCSCFSGRVATAHHPAKPSCVDGE